jgi:hypothetical protein
MGLKLMTGTGDSIRLEGTGLSDPVTINVLFVGEKRCQIEINAPRETVLIDHLRDPVSPRKQRQLRQNSER